MIRAAGQLGWLDEERAMLRLVALRQRGAARVRQGEHFRGFIESLTGGIIARMAEKAVSTRRRTIVQVRVTAGNHQADERTGQGGSFEKG